MKRNKIKEKGERRKMRKGEEEVGGREGEGRRKIKRVMKGEARKRKGRKTGAAPQTVNRHAKVGGEEFNHNEHLSQRIESRPQHLPFLSNSKIPLTECLVDAGRHLPLSPSVTV